MGFFNSILGAAKYANEDAHGERLFQEVQSTFSAMQQLEPQIQQIAMLGFIQIRERLIGQMANWSRQGCVDLGRTMQRQARDNFDIDMAGSCAKWLAGAWLESKERESIKAQQTFGMLEEFADYVKNEIAQISA